MNDIIEYYKQELFTLGYMQESDCIDIRKNCAIIESVNYFIAYQYFQDGILITHLYVKPEHRKRHIAKDLITTVEMLYPVIMKGRTDVKLYVYCHKNNPAKALYEKLLFIKIPDFPEEPDSGRHCLYKKEVNR
ncbi:hypothetical protein FACS1894137_11250 [Spirochaetia bacterium]|nr:hypothetical protein FACS1894137_11250 [Spirochaetia bacterium]